ncbi:hypothetical protein DAPPUDRAFT_222572 [Daphnia pulex]|uniref:CRAL-TRIO domain-containing protein n=1 Tax=Daphnia pulex TaxID=6669 RepID=E9G4J1_DAPPU|nr:hypothetical protein DAPPUDRAFT_222572 [Daphnia pulex]|eukprot:EFX85553.1 hypothetical protein DAPPUDRAFT_222572 [Daphnia pulex]
MEWRHQHKINTLLDDFTPPEVLAKYFSAGYTGVDKLNSSLLITRFGAMDLKGMLLSAKKRDYLMTVVEVMTVIFDMAGFSMRHITFKPVAVETTLQLLQISESKYPELLRCVFVINAQDFAILYSMMKPFMHEKTKNKVQIYSHDSSIWKAALLAEIDRDQLPVCYGGTMTDPDGNLNCVTKVGMGGEVPRSYYLDAKPDPTNKKTFTVSRGSKEQLEIQIKQAGAILKWDFYTEEGDLAFAVYRKKDDELIPIVSHDRIDCDVSPEEGEIRCDYTGVYVVEFDNSYSYFRSKKIWFSITVYNERIENTEPFQP